eukprot:gene11447-11537_t
MQQEADLNDLQAISILSGIPLSDLQNIIRIDDLHEFALPLLTLAEEIKSLYDSDEIPKSVTFHLEDGYKTVFVMHNLSVEPAGAFMAARDIIAEEISAQVNLYGPDEWQDHFNPSLQACAQVLAHYFYCRATGKPYNEYEAEAFTGEIKKLRVSFDKFKYINTINSLAGGDVCKWAQVLNLPYERVLTKLLLNKTEAEYQKRYSALLEKQ